MNTTQSKDRVLEKQLIRRQAIHTSLMLFLILKLHVQSNPLAIPSSSHMSKTTLLLPLHLFHQSGIPAIFLPSSVPAYLIQL